MIRDEFHETVVGRAPEGWTLGHVTLQLLHPDERVSIEAWRRGSFAVHELVVGFRLTHAPTGLRIWNTATPDEAVEIAETIEGLADWTCIRQALPAGHELYPEVRKIIDAVCRAVPLRERVGEK